MEIIDFLNQMKTFFENADKAKQQLEEHISEIELARNDLLHELELAKLNGAEMMKLSKTLKDVLIQRRQYKDKLQEVMLIKNFTDKYNNKLITGDIMQLIKNLNKLYNTQKNRTYTPRLITNLKCVKENKKNDKNK